MVIKNAMICDKDKEEKGDIRIQNGKITKIALSIQKEPDEEVFDAKGLVLMPSAIDLNTTLKDSKFSKDNLIEFSKKCAKGGVGVAVLMPNLSPSLNSEIVMELLNALSESLDSKIIGAVGSAKDDEKGLNDISSLYKKGACGIYARSFEDGNLLKRACEFSLMLDIPMFFACEDKALNANGVMNDSELSSRLGLVGISNLSEIKEVAMMSEVATFMQTKAVFQSIATLRSVEILQNAKQKNPNIFIQSSIHHLMLNEDLCNNYNTFAKIKPPLKSESTRAKLVKCLKEGKIDLITSLQSEKSLAKKDLSFDEAEFGVDMLEYFVPMCYTLLVKDQRMTLKDLSKIISYNPAQILGFDKKGLIKEGYDADFILLDTKASEVMENAECPYYDWIFSSKVEKVFYKGMEIKIG